MSYYAHDRTGFDGRTLRHLPHVSSLSVSCHRARDIEEIARLQLVRLQLEVFELETGDLLSRMPLDRLIDLTVAQTRRNVFTCMSLDTLGNLARFHELEDLALAFTALDLEVILNSTLPGSLRAVRLATGKVTRDRELRKLLDERGYREFPAVVEH